MDAIDARGFNETVKKASRGNSGPMIIMLSVFLYLFSAIIAFVVMPQMPPVELCYEVAGVSN